LHKILTYSKNIEKKILKITQNKRVPLILDAVGGVKETFESSIKIVAPGGQITKIGWFLNQNKFDLDKLIKKNIRFQGSFSHNYPIWEQCIKLLSQKKIVINDVITNKFSIKDWKLAFNLIMNRKSIKILLDPSND
jgi:alcohol dehydrogenase/L-iditol 2-dehydrogenase